jgi:vacuolar-type H+-ATPase subunit B/Vma2
MKRMLAGFRGPVQTEAGDSEFCIVFAAMGVNMETAHFFKQVLPTSNTLYGGAVHFVPEGSL